VEGKHHQGLILFVWSEHEYLPAKQLAGLFVVAFPETQPPSEASNGLHHYDKMTAC
jgi:hypothetical protein